MDTLSSPSTCDGEVARQRRDGGAFKHRVRSTLRCANGPPPHRKALGKLCQNRSAEPVEARPDDKRPSTGSGLRSA